MGLFGFMKKKKSVLIDDIKTSSAWIITALNSSGYKVDMNIESVAELERFFCEQMDDEAHAPKPGGLLSEKMGQRLFAIGSYVGEVLISEYGGRWITDDNDAAGEVNISVELSNGLITWPVQRVMKRCSEGAENNTYHYVIAFSRD